jgi:hypothetical protein
MKKYLNSFSERSIRGSEDMYLSRISLTGRCEILPNNIEDKIGIIKEELSEYLGTRDFKLEPSRDNRRDNFIIIPIDGRNQIELRDRYISAIVR